MVPCMKLSYHEVEHVQEQQEMYHVTTMSTRVPRQCQCEIESCGPWRCYCYLRHLKTVLGKLSFGSGLSWAPTVLEQRIRLVRAIGSPGGATRGFGAARGGVRRDGEPVRFPVSLAVQPRERRRQMTASDHPSSFFLQNNCCIKEGRAGLKQSPRVTK